MDQSIVSLAAQLGFPAAVALIILRAYQELAPRLIKALEQSAAAQERVAAALESNTRMVQHLADTVTWLEKRLIQMDAQQRNGETTKVLP